MHTPNYFRHWLSASFSRRSLSGFILSVIFNIPALVFGQPYSPPDRGEPGDEMIQAYLRNGCEKLEADFLAGVTNAAGWESVRPKYLAEYLYMLGLSPLPEKTPLQAIVTGRFDGDGFQVEMLHYQSRPHLYVTANLYRPAVIKTGERLPAVLYVCGHSNRGRNGNKTAYQSHGMWFARHGYVCLVLDSLQLGEIAAIHHGTYREGRWWWHSMGYTPAGVECWNGVRGIDYLVSRPEVDPERIAVSGISGGGAATYWITSADTRVKVAVAVSGMADLQSYVANRVINGHCDCMFLYNTFAWPWTRIAALIAPRPFLFVNSDHDDIFPMDANERIINRLERLYSLFGAGDRVDSVVSMGGHAYRQDIRQAAYRFINSYLKNDPRPVLDSEVDLESEGNVNQVHPIPLEKLRVFPADTDIPRDQLNTRIDEFFVPQAQVTVPLPGEFASWKKSLLNELRRVSFGYFPSRVPPANLRSQTGDGDLVLGTEPGIEIRLRKTEGITPGDRAKKIYLIVAGNQPKNDEDAWISQEKAADEVVFRLEPRGVGATRWTRKNPPNYVERAHVLLGKTVDAGRVWDVIAGARYLRQTYGDATPIIVAGREGAAVIAAYAALLEEDISGVFLRDPALSHKSPTAPAVLNVLRICDVPEVLGMLAPRPLTIKGNKNEALQKGQRIYTSASASAQLALP